jgi:hypothetical protein
MREENVTDTAAIRRIRKSLTAAVTGLQDHEGRIDILQPDGDGLYDLGGLGWTFRYRDDL